MWGTIAFALVALQVATTFSAAGAFGAGAYGAGAANAAAQAAAAAAAAAASAEHARRAGAGAVGAYGAESGAAAAAAAAAAALAAAGGSSRRAGAFGGAAGAAGAAAAPVAGTGNRIGEEGVRRTLTGVEVPAAIKGKDHSLSYSTVSRRSVIELANSHNERKSGRASTEGAGTQGDRATNGANREAGSHSVGAADTGIGSAIGQFRTRKGMGKTTENRQALWKNRVTGSLGRKVVIRSLVNGSSDVFYISHGTRHGTNVHREGSSGKRKRSGLQWRKEAQKELANRKLLVHSKRTLGRETRQSGVGSKRRGNDVDAMGVIGGSEGDGKSAGIRDIAAVGSSAVRNKRSVLTGGGGFARSATDIEVVHRIPECYMRRVEEFRNDLKIGRWVPQCSRRGVSNRLDRDRRGLVGVQDRGAVRQTFEGKRGLSVSRFGNNFGGSGAAKGASSRELAAIAERSVDGARVMRGERVRSGEITVQEGVEGTSLRALQDGWRASGEIIEGSREAVGTQGIARRKQEGSSAVSFHRAGDGGHSGGSAALESALFRRSAGYHIGETARHSAVGSMHGTGSIGLGYRSARRISLDGRRSVSGLTSATNSDDSGASRRKVTRGSRNVGMLDSLLGSMSGGVDEGSASAGGARSEAAAAAAAEHAARRAGAGGYGAGALGAGAYGAAGAAAAEAAAAAAAAAAGAAGAEAARRGAGGYGAGAYGAGAYGGGAYGAAGAAAAEAAAAAAAAAAGAAGAEAARRGAGGYGAGAYGAGAYGSGAVGAAAAEAAAAAAAAAAGAAGAEAARRGAFGAGAFGAGGAAAEAAAAAAAAAAAEAGARRAAGAGAFGAGAYGAGAYGAGAYGAGAFGRY